MSKTGKKLGIISTPLQVVFISERAHIGDLGQASAEKEKGEAPPWSLVRKPKIKTNGCFMCATWSGTNDERYKAVQAS